MFPIIQRRGVRKSHLDFSEGRAGDRAGSESGRNSRGISGQKGIIYWLQYSTGYTERLQVRAAAPLSENTTSFVIESHKRVMFLI